MGSKATVHTTTLQTDLKRKLQPYLWFAPTMLVVTGILLYPLLWSLYLSFCSWSLINPDNFSFVWLDNYINAFKEPGFLSALKNSGVFLIGTVVLQMLLGLGSALALDGNIKGKKFFLACFTIPYILSPAMAALIWRFILHEEWGIVNYLLEIVGIGRVAWLSNPHIVMGTIVIIDAWRHFPFVLLMMWAGLQSIPQELHEAAQIDGANALQKIWYVIIPFLKPLILIAVTFRIMFAIRAFSIINILYPSGGPGNAAEVVGVYLNQVLKSSWELGQSSAIAFIMFLITFALSFGMWFGSRRQD